MGDRVATPPTAHVVDGGERACGELLLELSRELRELPAGSLVRLVATDPAAVIDVPAWCHLSGNRYVGQGRQRDGRAHYDLVVAADPARTVSAQPWRLERPPPPPNPARQERSA